MVAIGIGNGSNTGDDESAVNENDDDLDLTEAELAEQEALSSRNFSTTISMESARRTSFRG
ncbi:hypothetical protein PC116_g31035 [Phytophthora cactorum]|nr:hypothetical protein PC119_g27536 [Phytophthora cactorum]KAG2962646.1 hypothetical protein PC120_g27645 [Phytophthora cactorum]KAG3120681.1 hypothetical protein C6341_g27325 [Phytophthora cactorum]KAG4036502.1 hypothetical protein PC123_g27928 [Phytophthora cactorum]KAG4220486.1 hypothetical protein PC116_g31035 [Phytophthora cactorum]